MSSSQFFSDSQEYDEEIVTLYDDQGRSLDCYIENEIEFDNERYVLLKPIDTPVVIFSWDEDDDQEISEAIIIEDSDQIKKLFSDAKAVLAELDLSLENTAFSLTVSGDLPILDEDNIFQLKIESERNQEDEEEEFQFLASFYNAEQKYNICTPCLPFLFVAKYNSGEELELLSSENEELERVLEELLSDTFEDLD